MVLPEDQAGAKKIRGERVGSEIRERAFLISRVYCLIKGMNPGKLAHYLWAQNVKVNVCNTILLIFTSRPCSSPPI
jgi:hypothetical protein